MKKILSNQIGFSLMTVMVAAGMFGGLALGVMRFMQTTAKSSKTLEANSELNLMHDQILLFLKNPANCNATFKGREFGPVDGDVVLIPLQRGLNESGDVDPDFTGLTNANHKIQLLGMRIYDPVDETVPPGSKLVLPSTDPEIDGWWAVVEFHYTKYRPAEGQASKIFGGTEVKRWALMKFNNFQVGEWSTNPELCNSKDFTIAGEGQELTFDDGTTEWIGPCLDGNPDNLIQECTIL